MPKQFFVIFTTRGVNALPAIDDAALRFSYLRFAMHWSVKAVRIDDGHAWWSVLATELPFDETQSAQIFEFSDASTAMESSAFHLLPDGIVIINRSYREQFERLAHNADIKILGRADAEHFVRTTPSG